MKMIKMLLLSITLLCFTPQVHSQLLASYEACILNYGTPDGTGSTKDGDPYIYYDTAVTTDASGTFIQRKAMYFMKDKDGELFCFAWKLLEPKSEVNSNVAFYNSKFVKIGKMEWEDYETKIIYKVYVEDDLCLTEVWYDYQ